MIFLTEIKKLIIIATIVVFSSSVAIAKDRNTGGSLERFENAGVVEKITSTELVISGEQYRFSTPLTIRQDSLKKSMGLIQPGDVIWVKGKILIGVPYIDTMRVLPDDES